MRELESAIWREERRLLDAAIEKLKGQSGEIHSRISHHACFKRFDRVRVLPLPDSARTRCHVERHIRELVGETFYPSGESVRDRIEMRRKGEPVDVAALSGTGPIAGMVALLRWLLA